MSRTDHIPVKDVMHHGILSCRSDAPVGEVAAIMAEHRVHAIAITNGPDARPTGVVSDLDVIKASPDSAEAGAELPQKASLNAQPRTCSRMSTIAGAILAEADELGASAIVMGSRGLTGLKSLLLGSVSHAVIQHTDHPVIVVPSPDVADSRARGRHHRQST